MNKTKMLSAKIRINSNVAIITNGFELIIKLSVSMMFTVIKSNDQLQDTKIEKGHTYIFISSLYINLFIP